MGSLRPRGSMWFSQEPTVELDVCGRHLSIVQDNSTMHVGTTVWESSLALAKWLEHNRSASGGHFSHEALRGKRAVELGSGCGIAGMAAALMGCDVLLTDIPAVLPILKRNVKRNFQSLTRADAELAPGRIKVAQLVWGNRRHIEGCGRGRPYDVIVAADLVYLEEVVEPLISTMRALAGAGTLIALGYKLRQDEAHALFWRELPLVFHVQKVAAGDLHPDYRFDGVDLYILQLKEELAPAS